MKAKLTIEIPNFSFSNDPVSLLNNVAMSLKRTVVKRDNFWGYHGLLRKEAVQRGERHGAPFGTFKLKLEPSTTDHGSRSATLSWHDMEFEEF